MSLERFRSLRFSKLPEWLQKVYIIDLNGSQFVVRQDLWGNSEKQHYLMSAGLLHIYEDNAEYYAKVLNKVISKQLSQTLDFVDEMQNLLDRYKNEIK